ncbi:hypothetical protein Daura_01700 [Dactylosporangium aurantiacum]|uniref:Uncharacterized protein n=1 Tax=Dactylosporangium aurantiacum TaxID=35754 RepID=A0A9Q9IGC8_9ACTN|nr:hypothetical protein [Dactylosporangium aurantiacum]MDG6100920.1 hypothetical protein [Dactylosporangium aurantiacum]UWZ55026.1 hypothetical protein Daura_01700 [Dactylosporangium aurantiacum]
MATSTSPDRRPRGTVAFIVRLLLPLALIVPTVVLFGMHRQSNGDDAAFATTERHGVAYLRALVPLEIELVNAQAAAATGSPVQRGSLMAAVGSVAELDAEHGAELLTRDRWADLRARIEAVPPTGAPGTLFASYSEAVELLLDLISKVREASGLARDPYAATFNLADGGAQELPDGIAAAGRYAGLLLQARRLPAAGQADALFGIAAARSDLIGAARDLAEDVQAAAQSSESHRLDGSLLTKIDAFTRATDALVPATATASATLSTDPAQLGRHRDDVVRAGAELSASLLSEIDALLGERLADLDSRDTTAVAALAAAVLLGVAAPVVTVLLALRRRRRGAGTTTARRGPDDTPPAPRHDSVERLHAAR